MDAGDRESATQMQRRIACGTHDPDAFRSALLDVPATARDAWLDAVLGLDALPDDGPELPRGCVPYVPCPVDALLRVIDRAEVRPSDVFVDLGAGLGRASAFVHLLTGAEAIGVEIQPALVDRARALTSRLSLKGVAWVEGDVSHVGGSYDVGTVFFLYCPFGGERLDGVLSRLEAVARARPLRIACVDLPLPPRLWLAIDPGPPGDLAVYSTRFAPLTA